MAGKAKLLLAAGLAVGILVFYFAVLPGILKERTVSFIRQGNPELAVEIGKALPLLPAGMSLSGVKLTTRTGRSLEIGKMDIRTRLGSLLAGSLSFELDSSLYGGRLRGVVGYPGMSTAAGPHSASLSFDNIRAGDCSMLKFGRQLMGKMSGSLEIAGEAGEMARGNGRVEFKILNGMLPLAANSMRLEALAFERLEAQATLGKGELIISRLDLADKAMKGSFQGRVMLDNAEPSRSGLWLQGHLTFSMDAGRRQTLIFTGTLAEPVLNVL